MANGGIYAYVSNAGSREIFVLRLDPQNGDLTTLQHISVSGKAMPLAVSPDRRFLYAALRSKPYSIASLAIDPMLGTLTHLADTPSPDSANYISTDHSGRFLFAALNPQDAVAPIGQLSVSAIAPNGIVQSAHQVVTTARLPHAILADATNRYVFAPSLKGDSVARHVFDHAAGRLSSDTLPPLRVSAGYGPRHLRFHPNHRYLYLLNEYSGALIAYTYDAADGSARELQTVSTLPPDFKDNGRTVLAADLHLTPDGKFLCASTRNPPVLIAYSVAPQTGMLSELARYPALDEPRGFAIDPQGRYLIVAGRHTNSVACHAINRDSGALTLLKEYPLGKDPNWVEIVSLP